jgi:hypothetical protein
MELPLREEVFAQKDVIAHLSRDKIATLYNLWLI